MLTSSVAMVKLLSKFIDLENEKLKHLKMVAAPLGGAKKHYLRRLVK
jgi:hypothetical protein